jgi:uncharacterized protein (TIGR03435 family)
MPFTRPLLAAVLSVPMLHAQPRTAFDAVSIKRNTTGAQASDTNTTPGRLSLMNVTTFSVLLRAFGVQRAQIVDAPGWTLTERYDIVAVTGGADALNDKDRQPLLQGVLEERWALRVRREMRPLRVYSLMPSKSGSRLVPHSGPGEYAMRVAPAEGRLVLKSTRGNLARFVEILSGFVGTLVIDDSGLSGEFDFTLEWVQDANADVTGPSLFTALQEQLGLKLESTRKPVPAVIVEHIERPSEN